MKNSEGYPDPTAGKAMANIRKDDRRGRFGLADHQSGLQVGRVSDGMYPA